VLAGRCYEESALPYQPFVEALRTYIADCPAGEVTVQVAPRRAELSALLPELAGAEVPAGIAGDPERERFRLYDAVSSLLTDAAGLRPVVLLLDDVHWADSGSLLMLRHLARSTEGARLLILATYRPLEVADEHPLAKALAELRRGRMVQELDLGGLAQADVEALIAAQAGVEVAQRVAPRVARRTEGNPFFVEELLRAAGDEGSLSEAEGEIPLSVRDLLLRRLGRLDDWSRRTLGVAAVVGQEFDLGLLEQLAEGDTEDVLELLEAAMAAEVLVEDPGRPGRWRFAHALIQETIYSELSATRRALLHRRIGDALEADGAPAERAGDLARHFHAAGDLEKAFTYHRQAAEAAEAVHATETALEHVNGALVAGELLGRDPVGERSMRELLRSRAWLSSDTESANSDYQAALAAARQAGDRELEIHVLNGLGMLWHVRGGGRSQDYHEEALRVAEEIGDRAGEVSALNRLSLVHANELDFARAVELGERALSIAEAMGDERAMARAMDSLKFCALQLGHVERLEELTHWLERFHRRTGDRWYLMWTLMESAYVPLARNRWTEATARAEEALALARGSGDRYSLPLILDTISWIQRCAGDFGAALATAHEARECAVALETWEGWAAAGLGSLYLDLLAFDDAVAVLERGLAQAEAAEARGQVFRCLGPLALAHLGAGRLDQAVEVAGRAAETGEAITVPAGRSYIWGDMAQGAVAEVALAAGDAERAREILVGLAAAAEREGVRFSLARQARALGDCLVAAGEIDGAERELHRALAAAGDSVPSERWQAHASLARLAADRGDGEGAAEHAAAARRGVEEIAANLRDDALASRLREAAAARIPG
jgi:tetratricopeptide (TPR) repeat protein